MTNEIQYGPLSGLIGVWTGEKGLDVSPEPEGKEETAYFETITFSEVGDATNAGKQTLAVLHYRQIVQNLSTGNVFHDETGYWMWEASTNTIMHSLSIPRGVTLLAGGVYKEDDKNKHTITLSVSASVDDKYWNIVQSPFMTENAKTNQFDHNIILQGDKLSYKELMKLEIYDKTFDHTDENILTRQ